ncbi:transposase, partial [Acidobacteriota bacterium]
MPRAKRHYLSGYTWHITHRCHKKEFLLKFHCDRKRWIYWLYQAKQRFHISILNYMVTTNHIHLLAQCDRKSNDIANAIHLASGRTAWEYNQRKRRSGSFWEDRYHATAVETDRHLIQCMVYIDLNMVRAAVVGHPRKWPYCGYQEIVGSRQRYTLIDQDKLIQIMDGNGVSFKEMYNKLIEEYLRSKRLHRESRWTESV